jgi:hypothetical protein
MDESALAELPLPTRPYSGGSIVSSPCKGSGMKVRRGRGCHYEGIPPTWYNIAFGGSGHRSLYGSSPTEYTMQMIMVN